MLAVGQAFCVSPQITPGSRARSVACPRTPAAFFPLSLNAVRMIQLSTTLWSNFHPHTIQLGSFHVNQSGKVLPVTHLRPTRGRWSTGTRWLFRRVLVCTGCQCDSKAGTQNIRREKSKESLTQCCFWVCNVVFWCRKATEPLMCKV